MHLIQRTLVSAASVLVGALSLHAGPSVAAGMYAGEVGARSLARGGANIVHPDDPSAAWLNPAAITLASGIQLNMDLNLVFLTSSFIRDCGGVANGCGPQGAVTRTYAGQDGSTRTFTTGAERPPTSDNVTAPDVGVLGNLGTPSRFDGKTALKNQAGVQPIPRISLVVNGDVFGLDGLALAAFLFAPSNGDYAFGADAPTRYTLIDRDLVEAYYGLAAAYRFRDLVAVGGSMQFVTVGLNQSVRLSADQFGNEDPTWDIQVRINGQQDFIPSGNFGLWANPGQLLGIGDLEVAGSVQLGRSVRAPGTIQLESFGDNIQQFIDDGVVGIDVAKSATATAEFTLPAFYRVGTRYGRDDVTADGKNTVAFDVEAAFVYEAWSALNHILLSTRGVTADLNTADDVPGEELAPIVQPKDYNDAWSLRLGGTLGLFDRTLEVHTGGFYETGAIPNETYNVEFVDGDKLGFGVGVSGTLGGVRVDVGYSHIHTFDRTVGTESIVFAGSSGDSVLVDGETRTRVAMGRYVGMFDMLNVAVNVGIDEVIGLKKP